jgi:hypothetical protein
LSYHVILEFSWHTKQQIAVYLIGVANGLGAEELENSPDIPFLDQL